MMVFASRIVLSSKKIGRLFVDNLRVYVRGGGGGQGLPKYGGVGGRGGHVYVIAGDGATLKKLCKDVPNQRFTAANGENSTGRSLQGCAGADLEIEVPAGVSVKTDDGKVIGEVDRSGERVLVALGGSGGHSENMFRGEKGDSRVVNLDLKLIADIGLVGFPNAGKSTLLAAISRAKPKIASYPFTTLQPQIGIMGYDDHRQVSVADLPGLVEGAHLNVGMGYKFLKHIERTKLLLFVVDIQGFRLSSQHRMRTALETILLLNKELELYREDLVGKPAVLVLNKTDVEGSGALVDELLDRLKNMQEWLSAVDKDLRPSRLVQFDDIFCISAKVRQNTEALKARLRQLLDVYADIQAEQQKEIENNSVSILNRAMIENYGTRGV